MNVLLIGQDAFRAQFACSGHEGMVTPNFDRLANMVGKFKAGWRGAMPPE